MLAVTANDPLLYQVAGGMQSTRMWKELMEMYTRYCAQIDYSKLAAPLG